MNLLLIHQNFPGQYLHLVHYARGLKGWRVVGVGEAKNIRERGTVSGITTMGYPTPEGAGEKTHHYLQSTEAAVRRGQAVARALLELRAKGFEPDVVCVHPGWGEGLFVRDVYPKTPLLMFCEYYFRAGEADLCFDREFSRSPDFDFSVRIRNTAQVLSLLAANRCVSATAWQASGYPDCFREKIQVQHEGVNTAYMRPDANAALTVQPLQTPGESRAWLPGRPPTSEAKEMFDPSRALTLRPGDPVIVYVSRNLEPYRGFHVFMRALPLLQQRCPEAQTLIIGADGASYSPALPNGATYKAKYLAEVKGLDLSRVHFLDRVPYAVLRAAFQVAAVHVYLTYPFVLSWSVLESMACQGLLLASDTAPVREVIRNGKNGLLFDFFDRDQLVELAAQALAAPERFSSLRAAARDTVVAGYELQTCLAAQMRLLRELATGRWPAPRS